MTDEGSASPLPAPPAPARWPYERHLACKLRQVDHFRVPRQFHPQPLVPRWRHQVLARTAQPFVPPLLPKTPLSGACNLAAWPCGYLKCGVVSDHPKSCLGLFTSGSIASMTGAARLGSAAAGSSARGGTRTGSASQGRAGARGSARLVHRHAGSAQAKNAAAVRPAATAVAAGVVGATGKTPAGDGRRACTGLASFNLRRNRHRVRGGGGSEIDRNRGCATGETGEQPTRTGCVGD